MVSSTPFPHNVTQKKAAPEMSANAQQLRQLSIKTGVVRRCARQITSRYRSSCADSSRKNPSTRPK